jgi:hypothetical protein
MVHWLGRATFCAGGMQGGGRRQDDEEGDEVGEPHPKFQADQSPNQDRNKISRRCTLK